MNYKLIYEKLISKARIKNINSEYYEKHHIIPKSLGGGNEITNIVKLTPREHFIAHLLLSKIYGGKMTYTLFLMSTRNGYTNRTYENARLIFLKKLSCKDRAKSISKALKNRKKTEEHKKNWKLSRTNGAGWICTEKTKNKISTLMKGNLNPMFNKTHTESARLRISEGNKRKVKCPFCNKSGGIAIMKRWHFDNCKQKS